MVNYPQAGRKGMGIGNRGMKGEKESKGWKVFVCECGNSFVKHWKIKSSKPIIFTCGCEVFAKHIPKWVYDYPSIHVNEIEMLERCISKVVV